jgi:hypothetical protein
MNLSYDACAYREVGMTKRAAIYVRVSTDRQTIENQLCELHRIAQRRGWEVVQEYRDAGISGSKGREERPGLDEMLRRSLLSLMLGAVRFSRLSGKWRKPALSEAPRPHEEALVSLFEALRTL